MSVIKRLEDKLLGFELVDFEEQLEKHTSLPNFLRSITAHEDSAQSIRMQLILCLMQALYRPITMRVFLQAWRGDVVDPLSQDLLTAFETFASSEHLPESQSQRLKRGVARVEHFNRAVAFIAFKKACEEKLSEEEKRELQREATKQGFRQWQSYVEDYVKKLARMS